MKQAALILIAIWTLVMVQPALALLGGDSAYDRCSKPVAVKPGCSQGKSLNSGCAKKKDAKTDCSDKKNKKSSQSQDSNNCNTDGCNPTLGCSSGNFYVHQYYQISLPPCFVLKQMTGIADDNRIAKGLSECWHPPEA